MRTIRRLLGALAIALVASLLVLPHGSAAVIGDDYPAKLKAKPRDAMVDPWQFYNRECTSFVAWRLNNADGVAFNDYWLGVHWGNASNWHNAATSSAAKAEGVTTDNKPTVGSVAWWAAGSAGSHEGHVAWVAVVNSTSITIEEYNYLHAGDYDTRTIPTNSSIWPSGFLHIFPPVMKATKAPKITGTPQVGVALKSSGGTWTPTSPKRSYQWLDDGSAIAGATSSTFTPTAAQLGDKLSVTVTATKSGVKTGTSTSTSTKAVAPGVFATTTPPAITGAAQVGVPLTASTGTWSPAGSYSFQWLDGGTAIPGATSATFTPTADQLGDALSVQVAATQTGYTTATSTSAATPKVAPGTFDNTTAPSISGTPAVGQVLTASSGTWTPVGTYAYQWYAGKTAVPGATSATYRPAPSDIGKAIKVSVTAATSGYTSDTTTSGATGDVQPGTFATTTAPAVEGTAQVGQTLTATSGSWTPKPSTLSYQWLLGGKAISGATGTSLALTAHDEGGAISVRVTAARDGYTTATSTSSATSAVAAGTIRNLTAPSVSGDAWVGHTLTAHPGSWSQAKAAIAYQWLADGKPIAKATSSTFTLGKAQSGAQISVRVTASQDGYTSASATSPRTAAVVSGQATLSSGPTITGTAVRGDTLTAHIGTVSPSSAKATYQWLRNGHRIKGATGTTHRLTASDIGRRIRVRVQVAATGWTTLSRTSAHTREVRTPAHLSIHWYAVPGGIDLSVRVHGVSRPHPTGTIRVYSHGRLLNRLHVTHGRVEHGVFLSPGSHRIRVRFTDNPALLAASRRLTVHVG